MTTTTARRACLHFRSWYSVTLIFKSGWTNPEATCTGGVTFTGWCALAWEHIE